MRQALLCSFLIRSSTKYVAFALLAVMVLAGCGDAANSTTQDPGKPGTKKLRIAVIPKGLGHEFWKSVHAGALQAAAEFATEERPIEIVWQGPASEADIQGQNSKVRALIVNKVDGICLAPNHSKSLTGVVKEANAAKIPVVIFDSALEEGPEIVSYVATDNHHGGVLAAQRLAEAMQEKGNVILLRYRSGSESTTQREEGFLEEIAKHPEIKVLSSDQYGEAKTEDAKKKVQQLLLKHKEAGVEGLFAVCESNCNGALKALEDAGLAGKTKYVAFDASDLLIQGLKQKTVDGIVLQDPVRMGYLAVKAMVEHLDGKPVESRISTGEFVATPENMESDDGQRLLHPEQHD